MQNWNKHMWTDKRKPTVLRKRQCRRTYRGQVLLLRWLCKVWQAFFTAMWGRSFSLVQEVSLEGVEVMSCIAYWRQFLRLETGARSTTYAILVGYQKQTEVCHILLKSMKHGSTAPSLEQNFSVELRCPAQLTVTELVKWFPAFYRTWRFIAASTRVNQRCLSWARLIQFTPSHIIFLKTHFNRSVIC